MVDVNKIKGAMAEKGISQRRMAGLLGITEKTFYSRMKKGVFGTDEAEVIIQILGIKNPVDIFFAEIVT